MPKKLLILAIETSGRAGSAAIALGQNLLAENTFSGPMRHSAELFGVVCNLLDRFDRKPKDIEHIYISIGPGSFTGLRIAATLAKTMNLANNAKIVAVDTLDVIAANVTTVAIENLPEFSSHESRKNRYYSRCKTKPILHRRLPTNKQQAAAVPSDIKGSNKQWNLE